MSDPLSRGEFFQVTAAAGVAGASVPAGTVVAAAGGGAPLTIRWYGGGVYELATPDDKTIVLVDAWIWNNTGFKAFGIDKPAELSSAAAYAAHLKGRAPDTVIVALTHDHGDHIGDYFELLPALVATGLDVKTVGQSDLMRVGLLPKFKAAGLDNTQIVLNNGAGINLGGVATHNGVRFQLVPAVHSCASGYPAAGFIIDVGGARIYASGDTDCFGDMAFVGNRYHPDLTMPPTPASCSASSQRSRSTTRTTRSSWARSAAISSAPRPPASHRKSPSPCCIPASGPRCTSRAIPLGRDHLSYRTPGRRPSSFLSTRVHRCGQPEDRAPTGPEELDAGAVDRGHGPGRRLDRNALDHQPRRFLR